MKWMVNLEQEYRWEKLVEKSLRKTLDNGGGSWYNIGENWIKDFQDNWILNANTFGRYWNYHEATPTLQKFSYRIFWTFWQFATGKVLQCINIKVEIFRKFIIVCGSCGNIQKILNCANLQNILKTATVTGGGKACVLNPHEYAPARAPARVFFFE